MSETTPGERGPRQLRRLEILTDVIFALVIFRLFLLFPQPEAGDRSFKDMLDYFEAQRSVVSVVLIGMVLTIIHWLRSNASFGLLRETDNRHSTLAIFQLVAVLLFLYTVRLGTVFEGELLARILESGAAALMGYLGLVTTVYASKDGHLLRAGVTVEDARKLSRLFLIEPLTATLAIGTAFLGDLVWTLSWFVVGPLVAVAVRRLWK